MTNDIDGPGRITFADRAPSKSTVAHEIAHVLQFRRGQPQTDAALGRRDDPAEREAEHAAQQVASRGSVQIQQTPAARMHLQEREEASAMERAVYQFFQRLTFLFGFGGLKAYKAKFASSWEPRYLIYRHALDLPKVGIALGKVSKLK